MNIIKNFTNISSIFSSIGSAGVIASVFLPNIMTGEGETYSMWQLSTILGSVDRYMIVEKFIYAIIAAAAINIIIKLFTSGKWLTILFTEAIVLPAFAIYYLLGEHHITCEKYEYGFWAGCASAAVILLSILLPNGKSKKKSAPKKKVQKEEINLALLNEDESTEFSKSNPLKDFDKEMLEETVIDRKDDENLVASEDIWVEDSDFVDPDKK